MSVDIIPDLTLALNVPSTIIIPSNLGTITWIELHNESPFACLTNLGGIQVRLPAWYFYPVQMQGTGHTGPFTVTPYLQTIPGSGFTTTLHVKVYLLGETPPNTVPQPLGGSPINLAIASSVVNTNNPPATPIIFAEPVGDTSTNGAVNINNQGQATFGDATYNGALTILGTVLTSQSNLLDDILTFFFNNKSVNFSGKYTLINGTTQGNIQLFEVIQGSSKLTVITENSYISTQQNIPLISVYNTASLWMSGNIGLTGDGGYQVTNGGVTQNFDIFTTFAAAGGSTTVQANIFRFSLAHQRNAWDTLVIPARTTSKVATTFVVGQ